MPHHPDRLLPLQGASNFRDLGGYPGHGGRPLRWRRLFRSDHPGRLTDADHAFLAGLGLAQTFDFRGVQERAAAPYRFPGATQHSLAIEPVVLDQMQAAAAAGQPLTAVLVTRLMTELYRSFVDEHATRYAQFFEHVLQAEAPLLFHCTAGKDRTGLAAALLLLALGVPHELVMQDYLLTNQVYRRPVEPDHGVPPEALAVLWQVQEGFLAAALQTIDDDHGGLQRYLARRLGVGPAALQALAARYLQPG